MNIFGSNERMKGEVNSDDIPKQDLLNLCMKLNKRMKSVELRGEEMSVKLKTVLGERNSLMDLISATIDIPIGEGKDGDIDHIKDILFHHLNSYKIKNKELSDKIFKLENKLEDYEVNNAADHFEGNEDARRNEKTEKLKNKVQLLEITIQEKDTKIAYLTKKISTGVSASEPPFVTTADTMADADELARATAKIKELESNIAEHKRTMALAEVEVEKLRQRAVEADKKCSASSLLKAEQEALLFSLRKDLTAALNLKEINDKKIRELEEHRIRMEGKLRNLGEHRDRLAQAEACLDESTALVARLQSRLHSAETTLAQRTAEIATTEEKVRALQRELDDAASVLSTSQAETATLRVELASAQQVSAVELAQLEQQLMDSQKLAEAMARTHTDFVVAQQAEFDIAMSDLKKDAAKKCQAARHLLEEKIETVRVLTARNAALKEEVESGLPADRKIFELASKQANREATVHASRDARELAFQQLQTSLAAKDLDLAQLQHQYGQLQAEVAELRKVKSRETVNMDYLKNIVLQYMSFPASSPERAGLVPVISLLLQFSPQEAAQAGGGSAQDSLLWPSSRPAKELKIRVLDPVRFSNHNDAAVSACPKS